MRKWIDADEVEKLLRAGCAYAIRELPSIDIEPKRGEWIGYNADKGVDWLRSDGEPIFLVCNKCYGTVMNNTSAHWNFCPNCGADMREREGE